MTKRPLLRSPWLVVAMVVVAGCADTGRRTGDIPDHPTLQPASPIATATPSAAVRSFPATKQGAADFARYFVQTMERAYATGDPSSLAAISRPTCAFCQGVVESIREARDAGRRIEGVAFTLRAAETASLEPNRSAQVTLVYSLPATRVVNSDGTVASTAPPMPRQSFTAELLRSGATWAMADLVENPS